MVWPVRLLYYCSNRNCKYANDAPPFPGVFQCNNFINGGLCNGTYRVCEDVARAARDYDHAKQIAAVQMARHDYDYDHPHRPPLQALSSSSYGYRSTQAPTRNTVTHGTRGVPDTRYIRPLPIPGQAPQHVHVHVQRAQRPNLWIDTSVANGKKLKPNVLVYSDVPQEHDLNRRPAQRRSNMRAPDYMHSRR